MIPSKKATLSVTTKTGKSIIAKITDTLAIINFTKPFAIVFNGHSPFKTEKTSLILLLMFLIISISITSIWQGPILEEMQTVLYVLPQ